MAQRNNASRKQATQIAVLAFVAADCAGIYYAQHRLNTSAAAAAELAYETPGAPDRADPAALTFKPDTPALALAAPVNAAATSRLSTPAAPAAAAPKLAVAAAASAVPLSAASAALVPAKTAVLARAAPARLPVLEAGQPRVAVAAPAHPFKAPRIAPVAGLGAARMAISVPVAPQHDAAVPAHSHSALGKSAAADSPFANAFSLYDEAPDSEHRFGQDTASPDGPSSGSLADLVAPRDAPAPMFDKAGIGAVTGQAASIDAPAPADVPVTSTPAELPAIKG